jgi:LCP family protein required for cell wall assembly
MHRVSFKKIFIRSTLLVLVAILSVGGWLGYKLYADAAKITGDKNPLQLVSAFTPSQLSATNGHVNILLAGYSVDDSGHQGAELTDSIMIVSYDTQTKTVAMVSIPRDTLVDIPGFGYQKINAAYEDGQTENFSQSGYPSGGMGLLEEVVQQNFGVQANYYGLIDYAAFSDAVNDVGGVTVTIQSTDSRGLYDPNTNLDLPNGTVMLNGQQALNLARARGDGYGSYGFPDSDFDRTQHQQQLLAAILTKAGSASTLSNPLKIGELADAVGNNFKTDLTIGDMETLFSDLRHITTSQITSLSLNNYNGKGLFADYTTRSGQEALIPAAGLDDFTQIQAAIQTILN